MDSTQRKLTAKQQRFVEEYIVDLNATKAAIRAGYSVKSARQIGAENLSKPYIQAAIQEAMDRRAVRTDITADDVLAELAKIGFANLEDYIRVSKDGDPYVDLSAMTREQAAAISEVSVEDFPEGRGKDARMVRKVRVKFHDKKSALVDIGKHLGMFKTKVEVSGPDGGPLEVDDLKGLSNKELEERLRLIRAAGGSGNHE